MKRKFKRGISYILCVMIAMSMMVISPIVYAEGIENPVYDSDTETSVYSYVYFGHYPQSEIKGYDLTDEIINANYNKYGIGIVNRQQIFKKSGKYYLVEPIKWKVLNIDNNYMLLQTDNVIAHGIKYNGGSDNSWKISDLRSWLNGYSADKNSNSNDYTALFENFNSVAFFEDEYDICQLMDLTFGNTNPSEALINPGASAVTTSDYITIPDRAMVTNNDYGFYQGYGQNASTVTRQKTATDYAKACAPNSYHSYWYLIGGNYWDGYVSSTGSTYTYNGFSSTTGIAPIVKILVNSDQYYTSKPELVMGKDISSASVELRFDSIDYSGEEKKPDVTVKDGNKTLVENVDYTVKYSDNINAGTAKVTVSGCGNYYGDNESTFTINRLDQVISRVEPSYTVTNGDEPFRLNAVTSGDGAITYSSSNESVVIAAANTGKITIVGTGRATVTVTAAQTENYNEAVETVEIIVLPGKATEVNPGTTSGSSVQIAWGQVDGASGYEVYRYSETQEEYLKIDDIPSGGTTTYTDVNVSKGKTYNYKIRAYFKDDATIIYGEFSPVITAVTMPDQPTGLKQDKVTTSSIKLSWNAVAGAAGYSVYRYSSNQGEYVLIGSVSGGSTTYTDTKLSPGKNYYYSVRAYTKNGTTTLYGEYSNVLTTITGVAKVTGLKQSATKTTSLKLSWSKVSGASGYEVYRYNSSQRAYKKVKTITSGSTTSFNNTKLSAGKIYKYKVRAYVNSGSKKYYGEFSSVKSTATKPKKTKITKMKISIGARAWLDIKYKKVACTGYEIEYTDVKSFSFAYIEYSKSPKFSSMINSGKYWYAKVRPYTVADGETYYGSWSKVKRVKV